MGTSDKPAETVELHAFTNLDRAPSIEPYVAALEAFDALPQLQELKALARERANRRRHDGARCRLRLRA
jgi:hypothetical protein